MTTITPPLGVDGLPRLTDDMLPNLDLAESWVDQYRDDRGGWLKPSREVTGDAMLRARFYCLDGTAYTSVQPGDGTAYGIVVHDLVLVQAGRLREKDANRYPLLHYREKARAMGPCGLFGGELLVALPENRGGRCSAFSLYGPHVPQWIDERLGQGPGGSLVLAAWLTVFTDAVLALRCES